MKKSLVITSGHFDPLHVGHIEYLRQAKELATDLLVIVNSDKSTFLKKGYIFMPCIERKEIISSLKYVDKVVTSIDSDSTVIKTVKQVYTKFKHEYERIYFANGGDRCGDVVEKEICDKLGIILVYGLGAKIQSSSSLVKNAIMVV